MSLAGKSGYVALQNSITTNCVALPEMRNNFAKKVGGGNLLSHYDTIIE